MRAASSFPPLVLVLALCTCGAPPPRSSTGPGASAEVVTSWNARILEIGESVDGFLTLKGVRTAAMAHLAMNDALAAIQPRYEPYTWRGRAENADPVEAASEAAYAVALAQYPDFAAELTDERARWTATVGAGPPDDVGTAAARAVLARREGDDWNVDAAYQWHPMGPGVYAEFNEHSGTPEGFVFGAGWAIAVPFALDDPGQFRSPPPPAIDDPEYARAFNEVKAVGAAQSEMRTEDQAHLAMWWKEFVEKSHNRLARELTKKEELDLWDAARLFALLNASIFDGYVASFDAKFHYNHWRPYTAIRWASNDGNPATEEDPTWTNLHDHTYAFPSYPSAHGTVCAAAMTVMEDAFGQAYPFDMTIREVDSRGPLSEKVTMDPAVRSFRSFYDAAMECSFSRVYLGIHFRYDSDAGTELGLNVGRQVLERLLPLSRGG
ncbi:MAG: vanadium-dependent haloperoxidase [Gemmatimonadetes bacterium]|nr:vanadium-dependent haloperoxidase [Gemmatimonadota bacterium]NNM34494.1 vanadium-dependent haloperoxidase [Gemmatimonadota bacterium]